MNETDLAREWSRVEALFDLAIELPVVQREAFARRECGREPRVFDELMAMLAEVDAAEGLLDHPAAALLPLPAQREAPAAGTQIGAWRVLAPIGRGGMGEVYLAERADGAYEQQVALKLLHPDAVGLLGRFLAERRILARLVHPGIARFHDAGVDAGGRPYMAMEYVDGLQIVEWCRRRRSPLRERLELFLQACDAVAYAHQNLVVHRDLKPANIMVGADGRVRLLDFGVAKLLSASSADQTRDTPYTLAYAAPEQLTHGAITTATDVYALGVVLFELLTGRRPWAMESAPIATSIERILNDAAPLVSRSVDAGTGIDAQQLTGDLDAIVAKALRKPAPDRYPTVGALQADLRRHLAGEPVTARGTARSYLVGRFLHRHRLATAAAAAVVLSLAAGLAGTSWQAREAARERDIARTEAARSDAVRDYVMLMFREAGDEKGEGELTAKQVLERSAARLVSMPVTEVSQRREIYQLLGELYLVIDDFDGAAPIFRHYLASPGADAEPQVQAEIRHDLAIAEAQLGNADVAQALLAQAQAFWATDPQRYRDSLASSRNVESILQRRSGKVAEAIATLRTALAERTAISGRRHFETASVMNALALALMDSGQPQEADQLLGDALAIMGELGRGESAIALSMLSNQGVAATHLGDTARAVPLFQRAVDLRRKLYGRSAALAVLQHNLGRIKVRLGQAAEARPLIEDARRIAIEFTGESSPFVLTMNLSVVEVEIALGELPAAETELDFARRQIGSVLGEAHVLFARADQVLARLRIKQGRLREAAQAIDSAQRRLDALSDAGKPYLAEIATLRGQLRDAR